MDADVEAESHLAELEGAYRGHDGVRRWWNDFFGAFPDYTVEIEELRDLGDVTLARVHGVGQGGASATPLFDPSWQPLKWVDGKCVWWRNCATEAEALDAIEQRAAA